MENLRIPGPSPYPEPVRQAQSKHMINQRVTKFHTIMETVRRNTKTILQTQNYEFLLTGAGTKG